SETLATGALLPLSSGPQPARPVPITRTENAARGASATRAARAALATAPVNRDSMRIRETGTRVERGAALHRATRRGVNAKSLQTETGRSRQTCVKLRR